MPVMPDAIWRPIPENYTQPDIRPTQVILHVRAGTGDSLYGYWTSPGNGLESHFYIRYDGTIEQYVGSTVQADANLTANKRPDGTGAISVETEGLEFGTWTSPQLASILNICRWTNHVHSVPLRRCPGPDDPGIGYHVMFGAPGPWTPVSKSCPGPNRIAQYNDYIMPVLTHQIPEDSLMGAVEDIIAGVHKDIAAMLADTTHVYLPIHDRKLSDIQHHLDEIKLDLVEIKLDLELVKAHLNALTNNTVSDANIIADATVDRMKARL